MANDLPEEYIRVAAYYLWEKEGRPEGVDFDHWIRAQAQAAEAQKKACCDKDKKEDKKSCCSKTAEKAPKAKKPAVAKKPAKK